MRIIPVLDLLRGEVVRGVGGQREAYRPVVSRLTTSAKPLNVALAFYEHFGCSLFYVADLDAILGETPAWAMYEQLRSRGFKLWVDSGIHRADDAQPIAAEGIEGIIAGLETIDGPEELAHLIERWGAERVVFSLDLKNGAAIGSTAHWNSASPLRIAELAVTNGARKIIVLDLAQVGMNRGATTEELCAAIVREFPGTEIIAGGGIRDVADLIRLHRVGVAGSLVASALHDGRISRVELVATGLMPP